MSDTKPIIIDGMLVPIVAKVYADYFDPPVQTVHAVEFANGCEIFVSQELHDAMQGTLGQDLIAAQRRNQLLVETESMALAELETLRKTCRAFAQSWSRLWFLVQEFRDHPERLSAGLCQMALEDTYIDDDVPSVRAALREYDTRDEQGWWKFEKSAAHGPTPTSTDAEAGS